MLKKPTPRQDKKSKILPGGRGKVKKEGGLGVREQDNRKRKTPPKSAGSLVRSAERPNCGVKKKPQLSQAPARKTQTLAVEDV